MADLPTDEARRALASDDAVQQAMRTFEQWGGALRYPEAQKWHLRDIMAMRKVLEEFASLRAKTAGGAEEMRERAAQTAITAVTVLDNSACSLAMERALDIAGKKIRSLPLDPSPQGEGGGE